MIPVRSSTKFVQTVSVGCISRLRGQKISFHFFFKNLLVWNYKAQSFHIRYIASSRGPLPKLFKLCPWGQNWPRPRGSQFYIELYKEKFKRLLLLNCLWDFDQTQQELSLGGPLRKLFKWFWLVALVLWPLTFSSGERLKALWALLLYFACWLVLMRTQSMMFWSSLCQRSSLHGSLLGQLCKQFLRNILVTVYYKAQRHLKGLLMVCSVSILTKESYHYALSCEMAQVAWAFYATCVMYLRLFDG